MEEKVVSIVVITYNSAKYVLETLESLKKQTYSNLELIVSDDCSTDDTISVAEKWIEKFSARFVRNVIIKSEVNTGITPNVNRGIKAASGEYIKLIAGDDILVDTCIEELTSFCTEKNIEFAYSKVIPFIDGKENIDVSNNHKLHLSIELSNRIFNLEQKKQYRTLLTGFNMFAPGLFMRREFISRMGLFDEKYSMMEDYPFLLKITSKGYKLELLDRFLVKYRVRNSDSTKRIRSTKRKSIHKSDLERFEKEELIPRLKKEKMFIALYNTYIRRLERRIINTSDSLVIEYFGKIIGYLSLSKIASRIRILWTRLKLGKLHRGNN